MSAEDPNQVKSHRPALLLGLLAVLLFLLHVMFASFHLIDDAYISFRFSRNLALGHGFAFNPGGVAVEGYTNFSWVLLGAASLACSISPTMTMPALGTLAGAAIVALSIIASRRNREDEPFAGLFAGLALAASADLAYYAGSGLETAFFALLVLASVFAANAEKPRTFAALAALAVLTRPEGVLLCALGAALFARRLGLVRALREVIAPLAVVAVVYATFKWRTFGALLPNTLAAKRPDIHAGLTYFTTATPWLVALVLPALGLFLQKPNPQEKIGKRDADGLVYLALGLVFLVVAVFEGGDWMKLHRLFVPALGPLAIASDRGLRAFSTNRKRNAAVFAFGLPMLVFLGLQASQSRTIAARNAAMIEGDEHRAKAFHELEGLGIKSVGSFDIGLLGWSMPNARILDLGGLTDPIIAKTSDVYWDKTVPPEHLQRLLPDAFVFTTLTPPEADPQTGALSITSMYPAERKIQATQVFRDEYTLFASVDATTSYLHVFRRRPQTP